MDGFDGDMRDMLGCASHVEVCGDMRDMRDMRGYAGRTTSPKSGRGVCRFLDRPPPIHEKRKKGTANDQSTKKECLFSI